MGVEQVSHKSKVELGITSHHGSRSQVFAASNLVSIVQNHFCTLQYITFLQRCTRAHIRLELIQQDSVVFTISNILAKVVDSIKVIVLKPILSVV